jgi:HAD superfamily hydrolase (TIGR01509 family)
VTNQGPVIVFDLDGTLVDSVYQHVIAWSAAFQEAGIELAVWKIHRRVGMSGGLIAHALLREAGQDLEESVQRRIQEVHARVYLENIGTVRPLPGARDLLDYLTERGVPWTIATSGRRATAQGALDLLKLPDTVSIVTHEDVDHAKPDPDLFLTAAEKLGTRTEQLVIVGDSVWDLLAARRARALGVGLLSGGYGQEELEGAGAYRVYEDPADLLRHLDEIGIRT